MVAMIQKRGLRDFDWVLAILAIGIVCFGTIQIRYAQPTENFWVKQLIGLGIAIVAMLAVAFNDYRKLLNIAPAFYVFGLLLLVIVLIPGIGLKINGQRAWIRVPGIGQFQPSEFVKVTTAMMLARYFGRHRTSALTLKELAMGGLILGLPIALILLEHDVGQVITYLPILVVVFFLSAIRMRIVVAAIVLGVVLLPFAYWVGVKTHLVKNYQQERINVILDPEKADRRGFGYNTWQSILTVGEGGLLGADNSGGYSQSSLKFLPEPHTEGKSSLTIQDVALAAHLAKELPPDTEPGLSATYFFEPKNFTFPFGTHICVVEIERETGEIEFLRYVAVDDCGKVINPLLVDGQLHGGIVQSLGQALYEEVVYDEQGQLVTGTLMDYAIPRATQIPWMELERTETPSPVNPLGVKGVGEAGTIGATPAIVGAIVDALAPFGVTHLDMPVKPEHVWNIINKGKN